MKGNYHAVCFLLLNLSICQLAVTARTYVANICISVNVYVPNGPLSELMMPPIHSDLHVRHMDQLKTIMARFVIIFQYLQLGILEFSGCVLDGRINSTMG